MVVGFTGTREGMTLEQKRVVDEILEMWSPQLLRHGDCVGADHDAHVLAYQRGILVDLHPPIVPTHRAFCNRLYPNVSVVWPEKDYLKRDREIVDNSDKLIATPKEFFDKTRSGTWYTVRYAFKTWDLLDRVAVVYPDGTTSRFV